MMSVQCSGRFMYHDLQNGSGPESLSLKDNEIWLEKIHFDFSPEGISLEIELP